MKRLNSQNLLIASLLGLSTVLANSYPLVKAQSEPKLGCQATVDKILQEIRSKGVRRVKFEIYKGVANEDRTGNPTNKTNDQSDWGEDYYIQSDGTTKLNKCVKPENAPNPLPWGLSICL
jgi:hypothetical protein